MSEVRVRTQGHIPSEVQPQVPVLQQLQVRVLRPERHDIREHPPRPAYVALRNQPRECVTQGHIGFAVEKETRNGVLPVRLAYAASDTQGHGEGGI